MGDTNNSARQSKINRRKFLAGVGAGAAASVAGCTGGGGGTPTPRVETVIREEERTVVVEKTDTPTATPVQRERGDTDALVFNPMGYTGADDLIDEQAALMDSEERQPIVKKVLAQIWNDAPTNVNYYNRVLSPVNEDWEGFIPTVGEPIHVGGTLNLRKADGSSGGRPTFGLDTGPNTLNIVAASSLYSSKITANLYTYGTALHPVTFEFIPWGYESWDLNVDNIGTSDPTITATLRDDLLFSDGTPVTAEDAMFSVDYFVEQETAGGIAASNYSKLAGYDDKAIAGNGITVDDPEGLTVNYFLEDKDNQWFTAILGQLFLPQHIWSGVDDYQKYDPLEASEGIVGSGPFELADFSRGNWFELDLRDEGVWHPDADYIDFLDDGAPFIDGVRWEIFGGQTAAEQAVLNGDVDGLITGNGVGLSTAITATNTEGVKVVESEDDGWDHTSFNLRRVPLDDKAFRQLLIRLFDDEWITTDLKESIAGRRGSYPTPWAYQAWRPPEPWDADSYDGIDLPNLSFPGSSGDFGLSLSQVESARKWLVAHPESKHTYTWEEANVPGVATPAGDNKVLHVNGKPLTEAHTNNFGEPGQGPLQISFNPPQEDTDEARLMQRWVGALQRVGIPAVSQVQSFNSQLPKIYADENFDMFAMGWGNIGINNDHYTSLFGTPGADLGY